MKQLKPKPVAGSMAAGLIASICCGGSLVLGSIGLGVFYSALGLSRYVPQVLAAGAFSIIAINYFYYRRLAKRALLSSKRDLVALRQGMFVSASLGIAAMAVSFVFLEWLNHAVVNPHRFLIHSEYGHALIPGVPNIRLIYALASFFALALLWALPFPQFNSELTGATATLRQGLRVGILAATAVGFILLVINAMRFEDAGRHEQGQHGGGEAEQHGSGRHSGP